MAALARKILVVDDSKPLRDLMVALLTEDGYDVTAVENGAQALHVLSAPLPQPDLILLDLEMPVMGGEEFLQSASENDHLSSMRVVVVSSNTLQEPTPIRPLARLAKPFTAQALLRVVEEYSLPRAV
ncbi:MAG: response regulator [Myxococcales bacterium]